jgi:hypothetical protein
MCPCNTIHKKERSITTQLLQLFNVRLYYRLRPYMAIIRHYNFMLFKSNFHKVTHFSNNNNNNSNNKSNNNNNSLLVITETTCDSYQNSSHNCVIPPKLQSLFAQHMVTFLVSNTIHKMLKKEYQSNKKGITEQ